MVAVLVEGVAHNCKYAFLDRPRLKEFVLLDNLVGYSPRVLSVGLVWFYIDLILMSLFDKLVSHIALCYNCKMVGLETSVPQVP